jgi:hypothetical protein
LATSGQVKVAQHFEPDGTYANFIDHIASGATLTAYAYAYGLSQGSLSMWLSGLPQAQKDALAQARKARAEACLDRGLFALKDPAIDKTSSVAGQLAIAEAKHYHLRAALSNKEYSERYQEPIQQATQALPPAFRIIISSPGATVAIEQDPADSDLV